MEGLLAVSMREQKDTFGHKPEMDGLRGIACLIVIVVHSFVLLWPETHFIFRGTARLGVWLFFAISAFLLTMRLIEDFSAFGVYRYFINRIFRIIPLFVLAVLVYHFTGTLSIDSIKSIFDHILLKAGNFHLWTIPVEFRFYLALPIIVGAMLFMRHWAGRVAAVMAFLAFLGLCAFQFPQTTMPVGSFNPAWYAINFGAGIAAAFVIAWFPLRLSQTMCSIVFGCSLMALIAVIAWFKLGDPDGLRDEHYIYGPLWAVMILMLYVNRSIWTDVLSVNWLVKIGEASYSIYLFHLLVVFSVRGWYAPMGVATAIIGALLLGRLSYRYLELPLYQLRRWPLALLSRPSVTYDDTLSVHYRPIRHAQPSRPVGESEHGAAGVVADMHNRSRTDS